MTPSPGFPGRMDIAGSFECAIARARQYCFGPFRFNRWLVIGLLAFLELFIQGAGGPGGGGGSSHSSGGNEISGEAAKQTLSSALEWLQANLSLVLAVAFFLGIAFIALFLLFYWLGSRGQVMLVRAVRKDEDNLNRLWNETRTTAWSLYRFRILVAVITVPLYLAFIGIPGTLIALSILDETVTLGYVVSMVFPFLFVLFVLAFVHRLILMFNRNFVVPLMDIYQIPCFDAWLQFRDLAQGNAGPLCLFVLVKIVMAIGVGITQLLTLFACCIGFIPIIGQAIIAPVYVFERAYSLCVLDSMRVTAPVFEDEEAPILPGDPDDAYPRPPLPLP